MSAGHAQETTTLPNGSSPPRQPGRGRDLRFALLVLLVAGATFWTGWVVADHRRADDAAPAQAAAADTVFPHTADGAADAWCYFLRRAMAHDVGGAERQRLFAEMVLPGALPDVKAEILGEGQSWELTRGAAAFAPLFVKTHDEDDVVRVTAWGATVAASPPAGPSQGALPPLANWIQLTTRMVWSDGRWQITSSHFEGGPAPGSLPLPADSEELRAFLLEPGTRPARF